MVVMGKTTIVVVSRDNKKACDFWHGGYLNNSPSNRSSETVE